MVGYDCLKCNSTIYTKFGSATLNNSGHYRIISRKEGNKGKLLHRLIYEDYHNVSIIDGVVCHHIGHNKENNHPTNLKLMYDNDHKSLHNSGANHPNYGNINNYKTSEETMVKISKSKNNTTNFFRVSKMNTKRVNQGFVYRYMYYDENGNHKSIQSVNIEKLKTKVLDKGLIWKKLN